MCVICQNKIASMDLSQLTTIYAAALTVTQLGHNIDPSSLSVLDSSMETDSLTLDAFRMAVNLLKEQSADVVKTVLECTKAELECRGAQVDGATIEAPEAERHPCKSADRERCQLWNAVLGDNPQEFRENLRTLGGHSLLALKAGVEMALKVRAMNIAISNCAAVGITCHGEYKEEETKLLRAALEHLGDPEFCSDVQLGAIKVLLEVELANRGVEPNIRVQHIQTDGEPPDDATLRRMFQGRGTVH